MAINWPTLPNYTNRSSAKVLSNPEPRRSCTYLDLTKECEAPACVERIPKQSACTGDSGPGFHLFDWETGIWIVLEGDHAPSSIML
jgi:hypothetical protein